MWLNKLSDCDVQQLKKYRLADTADSESLDYSSLLDLKKLPETLLMLTGRIGAPNACVTSSILIKRMAFYAVIHIYAMTALGKKLKTEPSKLKLIDSAQDDLWLPGFFMNPLEAEDPGENRDHWRDSIIREVFADGLTPLIYLLKEQTRLKEEVMWENIAVYVHWIFKEIEENHQLGEQAAKDRQYIFLEAPGKLFGTVHNPLTSFFQLSKKGRVTCCLSFMLRNREKKKCAACPLASRET
ncbi:IucA/IucC family C-terminal-domain containing protein [Siminovitchia sediminis]|uniref:IucA/IucC family C-terminal-domain containing protein n=1 Tax=Siminovitchia sediminis TaxID=1274353 RepID=A0ABW4KJU4_9BACI